MKAELAPVVKDDKDMAGVTVDEGLLLKSWGGEEKQVTRVTIWLRTGEQGQPTLIHTQNPTQPPFQHRNIPKKLLIRSYSHFSTHAYGRMDGRTDRQTDRHMAKIKRVECYSEPIFELRTLRGTLPILFVDIFTNFEPIKDTQVANNIQYWLKFVSKLPKSLLIPIKLFLTTLYTPHFHS